jgi:hypothetical protein
MKDQTTAAAQRGPVTEPQQVGISPNVKAELGKLNPEIRARIVEHLAQKTGNPIR